MELCPRVGLETRERVRESYRRWQSPKLPAKTSQVSKLTDPVAPSSQVSRWGNREGGFTISYTPLSCVDVIIQVDPLLFTTTVTHHLRPGLQCCVHIAQLWALHASFPQSSLAWGPSLSRGPISPLARKGICALPLKDHGSGGFCAPGYLDHGKTADVALWPGPGPAFHVQGALVPRSG